MSRNSRYRLALFAGALAFSVFALSAPAPAAIDMVVGSRATVPNAPVSDCSAKAKNALTTVLQNAFEAGEGTGQWLGRGSPDSGGNPSAAAAIHCFPVDKGYVVTVTCGVEIPPSPDTASALCTKLTAAFDGGLSWHF